MRALAGVGSALNLTRTAAGGQLELDPADVKSALLRELLQATAAPEVRRSIEATERAVVDHSMH